MANTAANDTLRAYMERAHEAGAFTVLKGNQLQVFSRETDNVPVLRVYAEEDAAGKLELEMVAEGGGPAALPTVEDFKGEVEGYVVADLEFRKNEILAHMNTDINVAVELHNVEGKGWDTEAATEAFADYYADKLRERLENAGYSQLNGYNVTVDVTPHPQIFGGGREEVSVFGETSWNDPSDDGEYSAEVIKAVENELKSELEGELQVMRPEIWDDFCVSEEAAALPDAEDEEEDEVVEAQDDRWNAAVKRDEPEDEPSMGMRR